MKKIRLMFSFVVIAAATAFFMGILGCEKDGDADIGSDLDAYFAANPYLSDPRIDTSDYIDDLTIEPSQALAQFVGQKINFTVSDGEPPYSWGVATPHVGSIERQENTRYAIYTVKATENNHVIASDADGRSVIAYIVEATNAATAALTITPAGHTMTSPYTEAEYKAGACTWAQAWGGFVGEQILFIATGGEKPYGSWRTSNNSLGTIQQNGLYTVNDIVTFGIIGNNTVSITDSAGNIATVTVTLKWHD